MCNIGLTHGIAQRLILHFDSTFGCHKLVLLSSSCHLICQLIQRVHGGTLIDSSSISALQIVIFPNLLRKAKSAFNKIIEKTFYAVFLPTSFLFKKPRLPFYNKGKIEKVSKLKRHHQLNKQRVLKTICPVSLLCFANLIFCRHMEFL